MEFNNELMENSVFFDCVTAIKYALDKYDNILISTSGGSDSDVLIHLFATLDAEKKCRYLFVDTGLEYGATLRHLDYLEKRYEISITRMVSDVQIPDCVKIYGVPFKSKHVSEMMHRLFINGFSWEEGKYEELLKKYPRCASALQWWCNVHPGNSMFNISRNRYLKEFLIQNPPPIHVSGFCCKKSKMDVVNRYIAMLGIELSVSGVRIAEGGVRSARYSSLFSSEYENKPTSFRPILFFSDELKERVCELEYIKHSDCYEVYGLKRTGCVGCPCSLGFKEELEIVKHFEPLLYERVIETFGLSHRMLIDYETFRKERTDRSVYGECES